MTEIDWSFLAGINLLQVAIVILAAYVTIRLLIRFWPWLRGLIALVDALGKLPGFIDRTEKAIGEIHHEVHYNNGSSVKDAVDRVERGVKGLYDRLDKTEAADAAQSTLARENSNRILKLEQTRPPRRLPQKPKEQ